MSIPDKISFRPGSLAGPMAARLNDTGETPSNYVRRLIAEDCGVDPPEMLAGNPNAAQQAEAANAARWGRKKKKRRPKSG